MKVSLLLVLLFSLLNPLFATEGGMDGGGGSEIEELFSSRAHHVISIYRSSPLVDMKKVKAAFNSLKNLEAANHIKKDSVDFFYQAGKLSIDSASWEKKFEKASLNRDVLHILLEVSRKYYQDESYNDQENFLSSAIIDEHVKRNESFYKKQCKKALEVINKIQLLNHQDSCDQESFAIQSPKHANKLSRICEEQCAPVGLHIELESCQRKQRLTVEAYLNHKEKCNTK